MEERKTVNLALQGGGSHGAFTWGVLDALLEDGRLDFEGVSATSAGAMNAAVMAHGITAGGPGLAREALEQFWRDISNAGAFYRPLYQNPLESFWDWKNLPFVSMMRGALGTISPYEFNPLNINPLRDILKKSVDFKKLHHCKSIKLFITATNVRCGTPKVFQNEDITLDAILASAALPHLFHAVEIDGEAYWDGGYMGNPSLWPLFYNADCRDILLVHINPITREDVPDTAAEIENRLNEITFNASLLKELRAIDFVRKLLHEDMLKREHKTRYKDILLHAIRTDEIMTGLPADSKFNTDWAFLKDLRDTGRTEARKWLKKHFEKIGRKASVNLQKDYLSKV